MSHPEVKMDQDAHENDENKNNHDIDMIETSAVQFGMSLFVLLLSLLYFDCIFLCWFLFVY